MHLLTRVLCFFTVVMAFPVIKYEVLRRCTNIHCENGSHCMESIILNNNVSETEAKCVCQGHFTGPRCEAMLVLSPEVIKAHYVGFKVTFHNVSNGIEISDSYFHDHLSYSVQYWKNSSEKSCSIATNIYSAIHGIDGLQMDTTFTFCAVTDPENLCVPREVNLTRDKNCLIIRTLKNDNTFLSQTFVLPVAIAVIVILVLTVIGMIFMIRRCFCKTNNGERPKKTTSDWAKERRKEKQREQKDINLVKASSVEDLLTDNNYASADDSINRRTTRHAGTSTFAPFNNHSSLPNVLEEFCLDENSHENESSHMLQSHGNTSEA